MANLCCFALSWTSWHFKLTTTPSAVRGERMGSQGCLCWPCRGTPALKLVDDSKWEEVENINCYAVFMAYMSLALKGLSFLVITWTTVVLLGGFVSVLEKKDFWSLTVVTLVQTAGIFDVVVNEKLSNMRNAFKGLFFSTMVTTVKKPPDCLSCSNAMLYMVAFGMWALTKTAIQGLVFIIVLCPLGVLYIFGLPISAGISLWRLVKHDYGNTDEAANLKPALNVLYSLAMVQGVLFCYRASYAPAAKGLVKLVAKSYRFKDGEDLVWDYLCQTRTGCEKDPSFARGRNLITYAVDQMHSLSPDSYISGVRILSIVIKKQEPYGVLVSSDCGPDIIGQHVLIKHLLVGSASSAHTLDKLLWTLDSRSPYSIGTRKSAARIVAHIAGSISLKQFPGGIQRIASLLETHEECRLMDPCKRYWLLEQAYKLDCPIDTYKELWPVESESPPEYLDRYKGLVLRGLRILRKLAASSEENCRVISNTQGLILRIMAPITLDLLHNSDHYLWSRIVDESLQLLGRLMTAAGDTGKKLRCQILNKEVIKAIENILKCGRCTPFEQKQAMGILCQLYMDTSLSMDTESRKKYINILLYEFASGKNTGTRKLAGEKLATIASKNRCNAMVILKANDQVLDNLIAILLQVDNSTYRISAAEILEQLCIPYIKDNEHLNKPARFVTEVVPKVLREILSCQLTEEHARAGAENGRFAKPGTDIEGQDAGVSEKDDRDTTRVREEQHEEHNDDRKLLAALLSLSVAVLDKLVSNEQDLGLLLDAVALGDDQFSLPRKFKEMVERNSEHTTDCLKILKLISMMAISMMRHTSCFVIDELKGLVRTLSRTSENMKVLDGFTIIESGGDGTRIKKPSRTLVSIVKEARDLVERNYT